MTRLRYSLRWRWLPSFSAFDIYKLDIEPTPLRLEMWHLPPAAPRAILDSIPGSVEHIPVYRDALTGKQASYVTLVEVICGACSAALRRTGHANPSSESGGGQHGSIPLATCDRSLRFQRPQHCPDRRRFASRHGVDCMIQGAMNVLMLDVATSVGLHHDNQIRQIRKRSSELVDAVGDFGKVIQDLREVRRADVRALGETASRLGNWRRGPKPMPGWRPGAADT